MDDNLKPEINKSLLIRNKELAKLRKEVDVINSTNTKLTIFIQTNIDVMKYKFRNLSTDKCNLAMCEYIKENLDESISYKEIDKILFKYKIYDKNIIVKTLFIIFMLLLNFILYSNFTYSSFNMFEIILNSILTSICCLFFSLIFNFVLFDFFKIKFYRIPKLEDL